MRRPAIEGLADQIIAALLLVEREPATPRGGDRE